MSDKLILKAFLFFHKNMFPEKYDAMMVVTHFVFLKNGFTVANCDEQVKTILSFSKNFFDY